MGLTPQQWETVKELFETAVEKPAADRALFLAGASQDAVVVHEVEPSLSSSHLFAANSVRSFWFFCLPW
jgi:hypothetical protein